MWQGMLYHLDNNKNSIAVVTLTIMRREKYAYIHTECN
jgi:hypothetical protein